MSVDTPKDRDLDELLADSAAVRAQFRAASQEEPPVELDDSIRAGARREIRARPVVPSPGLEVSWRIPASIAAVVVLGATVAVMMSQHDTQISADRKMPQSAADVGTSKEKIEPKKADAVALKRIAAKDEAAESAYATPPAHPRVVLPPPASPESVEGAVQKPKIEAQLVDSPARTESELPEPLRAQSQMRAEVPMAKEVSAPAVPASAPPSPTASDVAAKTTASETRSVVAQPLTEKRRLANIGEGESKSPPWEKDPQSWLAHVDELRVAGRSQDALASFRAFRDRYPDYQLPTGFVVPVSSE